MKELTLVLLNGTPTRAFNTRKKAEDWVLHMKIDYLMEVYEFTYQSILYYY